MRRITIEKFLYIFAIILAYQTKVLAATNICNLYISQKTEKINFQIKCSQPLQALNVFPQKKAKEFKIIFSKSIINYDPTFLPSKLKKIDLKKENNHTKIEVSFKEDFFPLLQKTTDNKYSIIFQKQKENRALNYELPKIPKEIYTPFKKEKYTGTKISIDIQNADIKSVLRLLSEVGNVNIVLGEEITGKITLKVKNVPWDQVLDIIMARFGLGKVELNGIIFIAPLSKLQKQAEELKKAKEALAEEEDTGPTTTEYITVNYINACELIGKKTTKTKERISGGGSRSKSSKEKSKEQINLEFSLQDILSKKGKILCDARTNTIIIKDTKEKIKEIKEIIKKLDIPVKQVLIEARIVEVADNFAKNLGIQWFGGYYKTNDKTNFKISPSTNFIPKRIPPANISIDSSNGTGTVSNITPLKTEQFTVPFGPIVDLAVPATSRLGIAIGRITKTSALLLDLQLSALEEKKLGKIVSAPRIITRDNGEAVITQGYQIPYLELTEQGTATTKFIAADLTLKVVPHILPNNEIRLEIFIDKSEPDWTKAIVLHGYSVPAILKRSAQTFVRVPNGGTVVIGGLKIAKKQEIYGKVPGLSKIPAVGNLFKNSQKSQEEQELLIFITSKVITSAVEEIDY